MGQTCTGCTKWAIRSDCPKHGIKALESKGQFLMDGRALERDAFPGLFAALKSMLP